MLTNDVKRKLKAGKPVVGVWLALGDAIVAESLAAQGWDWLTVDTEHNPIDLLTMTGMFQAIGRYPTAPLARIPEVSELGIKRIDEILSMPGIDACFIGPNDLCNSMGLAEGWLMLGCTSDIYHLTAGAKAALAAIKKPA